MVGLRQSSLSYVVQFNISINTIWRQTHRSSQIRWIRHLGLIELSADSYCDGVMERTMINLSTVGFSENSPI